MSHHYAGRYNTESEPGIIADIIEAMRDIVSATLRYRLWLALAKEDILDTYKHTSIGVLWAVVSYSALIITLVLIFDTEDTLKTADYVAHVACGLLVWTFISGVIGQGSSIFTGNNSYIRGTSLPVSTFVFHNVAKNLVLSGFAAVGAVLFILYYGYPKSMMWIISLPAIPFLAVSAVPVQLILGSIGAYAHDTKQIINNLMRSVFFLTPIFWTPKEGTVRGIIAEWNPITQYIEIFRSPIVEDVVPWRAWLDCLAVTSAMWVAALLVFSVARRKIVFWL